jgi:hypothetical protein
VENNKITYTHRNSCRGNWEHLTEDIIKKIANDLGMGLDDITRESLRVFLQEKRRKIKMDRYFRNS